MCEQELDEIFLGFRAAGSGTQAKCTHARRCQQLIGQPAQSVRAKLPILHLDRVIQSVHWPSNCFSFSAAVRTCAACARRAVPQKSGRACQDSDQRPVQRGRVELDPHCVMVLDRIAITTFAEVTRRLDALLMSLPKDWSSRS